MDLYEDFCLFLLALLILVSLVILFPVIIRLWVYNAFAGYFWAVKDRDKNGG